MLLLILLLVVLFAGGGGYYGYSRWGTGGGLGILGTVLLVVVLVYLLGGMNFPGRMHFPGSIERTHEKGECSSARLGPASP